MARSDAELDRLAMAAGGGDREALDALMAAVDEPVRVRCRRMLPNLADAEDAAQEVMLRLVRRIETFEGGSHFRTWLYRLVATSVQDTYRKLKRTVLEHGVDLELVAARERTSVLAGNKVDLFEALEHVGLLYREPLLLRDFCGLEYGDIAQALDVPDGTIRRRVHEGRKQVRLRLGVDHA